MKEWQIHYRIRLRNTLRNIRRKRELPVILVIFLMSCFFWLIGALNKPHFSQVQLKLNYHNMPANSMLANKLPKKLIIGIKGEGFEIIAHKLRFASSVLLVDLSKYIDVKTLTSGKSVQRIPSKLFASEINQLLRNGVESYSISPIDIYAHVTAKSTKKVPVLSNLKLGLNKNYMLKGSVQLQPDSITISGAKEQLDTLTAVECEPIEIKNLEKNTVLSLKPILQPKIHYSYTEEVNAKIEIEKYSEIDFQVPILVTDAPDSLHISLFPSTCTVRFNVGVSNFDKVSPLSFKASISYAALLEGKSVELTEFPEFLKIIGLSPRKLEFLVEKK